MQTSNYAHALFELAEQGKKTDIVHYQFEAFKQEMMGQHAWIDYMDSPVVLSKEKDHAIDELPYDILFLSFLKQLAEKRHMHALFDIFSSWNKLVRAKLRIAHVNIISAKPIDKAMETKLIKTLQPTFPHDQVSLHLHVDPTLIGGLKVIYQGQALDRSVARELEELFTML